MTEKIADAEHEMVLVVEELAHHDQLKMLIVLDLVVSYLMIGLSNGAGAVAIVLTGNGVVFVLQVVEPKTLSTID